MDNFLARYQAARGRDERERMTHREPQRHDAPTLGLDSLALGLSPLPVVGDVAGLAADAYDWYEHPENRGGGNAMLMAAGLLPFVPSPRLAKKAIDQGYELMYRGGGRGARRARRGGSNRLLDMSEQARMNRAREMGFDTDTVWYHGTDRMFPAFDDKKLGASTGDSKMGSLSRLGHWATDSEPHAVGFGELAAKKSGKTPVTRRLYASAKGQVIDFDDAPTGELLHYVLRRFREGGARTVRINNLPLADGRRVNALLDIDRSALRDVDATFDPKRIKSSNLLASLAALGVAVQTVPDDVELDAEHMPGVD